MSSRVSAVSAALVLAALGFACLAPPCVARAQRTIVVTSTGYYPTHTAPK